MSKIDKVLEELRKALERDEANQGKADQETTNEKGGPNNEN